MIKTGDILTLVSKPQYPCVLEVEEVLPSGTKVRVTESDNTADFNSEYAVNEVRPYSAKELFTDICNYYAIEEPSINNFYSNDFAEWINVEIESLKNEYGDVNDDELSEAELDEKDQNNEISVWFETVLNIRENEIQEVLSGIGSDTRVLM